MIATIPPRLPDQVEQRSDYDLRPDIASVATESVGAAMEFPSGKRPQWEIDRVIERLLGHDVRVQVDSFRPLNGHGHPASHWIPSGSLILPDNTHTVGLPVFFEGRLQDFQRQIGVIYVLLAHSPQADRAVDGVLCFRDMLAVILRGAALIRLAFPFEIEPLPGCLINYWRDLRHRGAQFELPLSEQPTYAINNSCCHDSPQADPIVVRPVGGLIEASTAKR